MVTLEDVFEAYYECRRKKRRAEDSLRFEVGFEDNLVELCDRINAREYRPSTSKAFVVPKPLYREVFAPAFQDRVVDTYIAMRLVPLFEKAMTERTFNCRIGKGSLFGVRMLARDIEECSQGYTKDCYVLKLDIKGFFMSIPKKLLCERVDAFICDRYEGEDKEELRFMSREMVMHRPETDFVRKSPGWMWNYIPPNKSLFTNGDGKGMAIGKLLSQIYANFFLNDFDHWLEDGLSFKWHGRYVDDFYIVSESKEALLAAIPLIKRKLKEDFLLDLHPDKIYLQHYKKGVKFTGAVVKPGRIYISNRTVAGLYSSVFRFNRIEDGDIGKVRSGICSLNSYFGLMTHTQSYAIRRKVAHMIAKGKWKYFYIGNRFRKFCLKSKYKETDIFKRKVRNGTKDRRRFD